MTKVILNPLQPKLMRWGRVTCWSALFLLCLCSSSLAANEKPKPAEPRVNPLEIKTPDPLLPKSPKPGNLSPEQQSQLRSALDQLDAQATTTLQAGKPEEAFDIWYRELRLRRVLGPVEEVQALGRVGEVAWQRTQKYDSQVIALRLQQIQKEAEQKKSLNLELLQALGTAYQQVHLAEAGANVYQQILALERQRGDNAAQEETLKTLAQLQMAHLDYPNASATYEQLLALAQAKGDSVSGFNYLQQLTYIYDQAKQPENALRTKQRLAQSYKPNDPQLVALKIAIASDYEALNKPDQASQNYQQAYEMARVSQQWAYASEALQKLATLYRSHNQPKFALQVYDILLMTQQQSYDYYGLMSTYDQIGHLDLEQKNYPQALAAFQQGLALAKSLQYQETYFTSQIEQVNKLSSQSGRGSQ